ncbi:hypothetical protein KVR01_009167 [Diaporthe batatas]|uniref:uncharacterized protein n=1 Tax=Diaporthe batatas TaxID=748121 RepID=UPI001D052D86|nr:uncharacterized protein KVR01_009167 [Diaporthe batatas]KAG8160903.1 hypothetical protein KVR01_009167 [Diaporthe batatas]
MSTAVKIHTQPFRDHAGGAAAMVFWAPVDQPLPPLYSFAVYVTSPQPPPTATTEGGDASVSSPESSFAAADLLQALNESRYAPETMGYRLDVYFQPGASVEHCQRHYEGERAARGTYADQLRQVGDGTSQQQQQQRRLPGLVPSYLRAPSFCHHDVLFMVDSDDCNAWRRGADLLMVEFRPAAVPAEFDPDPEELEEDPDMLAPTRTQRFPVCPDPEAYDGAGTVQGRMYGLFVVKEERLGGPYERALELGWKSW